MKLLAAVIVRNELARYLEPCVSSLLEYCDEVRILDDGSTDGWQETLQRAWGKGGKRVLVKAGSTRDDGSLAFNHHANARNQLLQFALDATPTWILAIDADELVADGVALRAACERSPASGSVFSLVMEECWELCDDVICVREDGGWRSHPVAMLWAPRMRLRESYRIADQGHATGRTPAGIGAGEVVGEVLHLGWANRAERQERYMRYATGDAGRFHSHVHIQSIMAPDFQVEARAREWPAALLPYRDQILARACSEGGEISTPGPREVVTR